MFLSEIKEKGWKGKKYLCQTFGGLKHISGMCIKPNIFNPFLILVQTFGWCKHIKNSQTSILEKYFFSEHLESF